MRFLKALILVVLAVSVAHGNELNSSYETRNYVELNNGIELNNAPGLSQFATGTMALLNGTSVLAGSSYTGGSIVTEDYTGALQVTSADVRTIKGGRFSGGEWFDTLADGTPLQPYETVITARQGSVKRYIYYPAREDSTAYTDGDKISAIASDGIERWYYVAPGDGGTSAASPPTFPTSGTVTDGTATWTFGGYHTIKGRENWPATTNKVTARKYNPTDTSNINGNQLVTFSVVDDSAKLASAGLDKVCPGNVYYMDNTDGGVGFVTIDDTVGNLNPHSGSVRVRGSGTIYIRDSFSNNITSLVLTGEYQTIQFENYVFANTSSRMQLYFSEAGEAWFILPNLTETEYAHPPIIDPVSDDLTSVTRAATVDEHPTSGVISENGFGIWLQFVPGTTGATGRLWSSETDASNLVEIYADATNVYFSKTVAGTTTTVSASLTHVDGTPADVQVVQSADGMSIAARNSGGSWTAWADDTTADGRADAVIAATHNLGSDGSDIKQFPCEISGLFTIQPNPKAYLESLR